MVERQMSANVPRLNLRAEPRGGLSSQAAILLVFALEAEEPVEAVHILVLALHALLCRAAAARRGHDDVVSGAPVGGGGAVVAVRLLQGEDEPLEFIEISARGERVVDDGADDALGVDDEHRADGLRVRGIGLDHAVLLGNVHADVLDEREGDVDVLLVLPLELPDLSQPRNVRVERIDGKADELDVHRLELLDHGAEGHELGRANGGKVSGVRKEDDPLPLVVLREIDLSLRGHGFKGRRLVANERHVEIFSHSCVSLSYYCYSVLIERSV